MTLYYHGEGNQWSKQASKEQVSSCFNIHVYGLIILGERERRQKQEETEEEEAES